MSYSINPVKESQCLVLEFGGDLTIQAAQEALQRAGDQLAGQLWRRLLIQVSNVTWKPSTVKMHELANACSVVIPPGVRIALVVRSAQVDEGSEAEDVACNHRLDLTAFVDAAHALAWLAERQDQTM